jgi:hypothetical protein
MQISHCHKIIAERAEVLDFTAAFIAFQPLGHPLWALFSKLL